MKTFIICLVITLILGWTSLIGLYGFSVYNRDPLVYSVQPFTVDKDAYTTSDTMVISSYRCNNEGIPLIVTTIERYFYNLQTGQRYEVPAAPGIIQAGCSWQDANVVNGFHPEMPSGQYVKRGVTHAKGRWREVDVAWQTEPFWYVKE